MEIRKVKAVFFSPTGTSEKITKTIAEVVAKELDINGNPLILPCQRTDWNRSFLILRSW